MRKILRNIIKIIKNPVIVTILVLIAAGMLVQKMVQYKQYTENLETQIIHQPIPEPDLRDVTIPEFTPFGNFTVLVDTITNTVTIGEITYDGYTVFDRETSLMLAKGVKHITIKLHSPGGELFAASAMREHINILKSYGIKITTIIAPGDACMSACPLIFAMGDERIADKSSLIMIHSPWQMLTPGYPAAVKIVMEKEILKAQLDFLDKMAETCEVTDALRRDILDHVDHFYSTEVFEERCPGVVTHLTDTPLVKDTLDEEEDKLFLGIPI